ncbi:D-alanyl-D-alanine carboxypeptidase [Azospirillum halopraeferens]|uniref:D-alanyl-D-alanine carboxypeptidase n=1 Tax=Azospirillum halopraeferens TaxID=34010 RepID=UPI0005510741|nr:D-alanyl-D-alanine carboxypeptidase [Azospirillum halopraeferens]
MLAGVFALVAMLAAGPALASKYAAIVMDARTGEVLHHEDADATRFPASLTKMMTLYLAFEALDAGRIKLDQALPVSQHAQSMPATKLGLRAGSTLRVEQAILALVTKSANDAAVVLAEALGDSETRFAEMMTRKARQLGMNATVFRNASGLPNTAQVTTARDMAVLSRALIADHPKYYSYFGRRSFTYGGKQLHSHNRLMSRYDGMDGIKTGYINASGFNLAASAVRDGRRLIAVVLGGPSTAWRDNRVASLLDDGFGRRAPVRDIPALVASLPSSRSAPVPDAKPTPPGGAAKAATVQAVVAGAPVPDKKPATLAAGTAPRAAAAKPGAVPAAARAGAGDVWGVQVGAFSNRASSQQALTRASQKLPQLLADAEKTITAVPTSRGTVYRARLLGFDEKDARSICERLQRAGQRCMPVAPSEGT